MNRASQIVIVAVALGAMAAAQVTPTPAPPATPAVPATPGTPATPRAPAPPARPARPAKPAVARATSYLGVDIRDITHDDMAAQALKLKEARGVEVMLVDRDGPAGKAGLKEHDVILSFNGRNIQSGEELRDLIRDTPPGQTVELGISRAGQPMKLKAQLADRRKIVVIRPNPIPKIHIGRIEVPIITTLSRRYGVTVENLTPQLGEVFGIKNGEGVLVRSVEKGSAADSAGLRAGDVIVRVGSESVSDMSDWNHILRRQKAGPVPIGIVRDKRQQAVSLNIPPESRTDESNAQAFRTEEFSRNMEQFGRKMEEYGRGLDDLNRLQPEIDRAMRDAQERIQRDLERNQREWQREAERAQREAQREAERAQRHAQRAREQAQRELERSQREAGQEQRERERALEREQNMEKTPPPEEPSQPDKPVPPQ